MKNCAILFLMLIPAFSCKKAESPYSEIPEITFESVVPSTAASFLDSITFTFKYKDGDGDLGENNANVENLFLTDNRISLVYQYRIKQLAPEGKAIPVQGSLSVVLNNTMLTDSSSEQTTTFSIYVVDRAGHQSNTITSSPVRIIKN